METISYRLVTNGRARRTVLGGDEYLVASCTLIVPGVLPGSDGPLLYTPEDAKKSSPAWNGVPITVYHPYQNGRNVSASDPGVLESQGIGHLRNARFDGKLKAEGWFHVEDTRRVDPRVLEALEKGRPIELSTGLFVVKEPAVNGATCPKGRAYTHIARDYNPDHLAVLPDQIGACSIADGCGILVNRQLVTNEGWTPVKNSAEPDPEMVQASQIKSLGDEFAKSGKAMPGYGQIFRNGDNDLWYVGGDGDEEGFHEEVIEKLGSVLGASPDRVTYESEGFPPKGEGWFQVHPKEKAWNSWTPIHNEPSDELDMDPEKACEILRDGSVHGKELTEAQRGMFGALCAEREKPTENWLPVENVLTFNACCEKCPEDESCEGENVSRNASSLSKESHIAEGGPPIEERCPHCGALLRRSRGDEDHPLPPTSNQGRGLREAAKPGSRRRKSQSVPNSSRNLRRLEVSKRPETQVKTGWQPIASVAPYGHKAPPQQRRPTK